MKGLSHYGKQVNAAGEQLLLYLHNAERLVEQRAQTRALGEDAQRQVDAAGPLLAATGSRNIRLHLERLVREGERVEVTSGKTWKDAPYRRRAKCNAVLAARGYSPRTSQLAIAQLVRRGLIETVLVQDKERPLRCLQLTQAGRQEALSIFLKRRGD